MTKDEILNLLKPIKVVKILKIEKHPNADRLLLADVDMGGETRRVITGAPNINVGDIVPYLNEGNVIPGYLITRGEKVVLEKIMLRGLESTCMILAEDEIGLSDDHTGLFILNELPPESLKISNLDEMVGKSIVDVLSDSEIEKIVNNQKKEEQVPEAA